LLQGVVARWGNTAAAARARQLLQEIQADPVKARRVADQGGADERRGLAAQARALERFGQRRRALEAWQLLAKLHPDHPDGTQAAGEARRVEAALGQEPPRPYLGLAFAGETLAVAQVASRGPADRAGVKAGDVLSKLGDRPLKALPDLLQALQGH